MYNIMYNVHIYIYICSLCDNQRLRTWRFRKTPPSHILDNKLGLPRDLALQGETSKKSLSRWHFEDETFRMTLPYFRDGNSKIRVSSWDFQDGTFKMIIASWQFQQDTFKIRVSKVILSRRGLQGDTSKMRLVGGEFNVRVSRSRWDFQDEGFKKRLSRWAFQD